MQLGLYLHKNPPDLEYKMTAAINMGIRIPPFAPEHRESAAVTLPESGMLHAIYPHMHYRGSSIRLNAVYPDGNQKPLLSVPNYQFQWQNAYQLKNPIALPAGTKIQVDAIFDNSAKNPINPDPAKEVGWGVLSSDEMLVAYLMYTTPRKSRDLAINEAPAAAADSAPP